MTNDDIVAFAGRTTYAVMDIFWARTFLRDHEVAEPDILPFLEAVAEHERSTGRSLPLSVTSMEYLYLRGKHGAPEPRGILWAGDADCPRSHPQRENGKG